jgi:pimeloyl-ACP methyl ester carboxylesterase
VLLSPITVAVAGFSAGGGAATFCFSRNKELVKEVYLFDPSSFPDEALAGKWLADNPGNRLCLVGGKTIDAGPIGTSEGLKLGA